MGPILQHHVDERRLSEGHEAKAPGAARLAVLHHHAVDHIAVTRKVSLQILLRRLPWQSTDE